MSSVKTKENRKRAVAVATYMTEEEAEQVREMADEERRSISDWLRLLVKDEIARREAA